MDNPNIEDMFADIEIDDHIFDPIWKARESLSSYSKLLSENPNMIVFTELLYWSDITDNDKGTRRNKAWRNLIKLLAIEFMKDPYWNSRIGWMIWFLVCYARYDAYYPMAWAFHYDPMNFYRTGEPVRPEGLERPSPDDPFNIKGECFVHPEWYTKEYKDSKEEIDKDRLSRKDKGGGSTNDSI